MTFAVGCVKYQVFSLLHYYRPANNLSLQKAEGIFCRSKVDLTSAMLRSSFLFVCLFLVAAAVNVFAAKCRPTSAAAATISSCLIALCSVKYLQQQFRFVAMTANNNIQMPSFSCHGVAEIRR